jgi:hypothetical protein
MRQIESEYYYGKTCIVAALSSLWVHTLYAIVILFRREGLCLPRRTRAAHDIFRYWQILLQKPKFEQP